MNRLKDLNLIDMFPVSRKIQINLISAIGISGLEKISITCKKRTMIARRYIVNLISSIPLFNKNIKDVDFSGLDLSDNFIISGIFDMKNIRRICLNDTNLNLQTVDNICYQLINSNVENMELCGIVIAEHSEFLFNSIRLSYLKNVNIDRSVIMSKSFNVFKECKGVISANNCFSDPLIQKLFVR